MTKKKELINKISERATNLFQSYNIYIDQINLQNDLMILSSKISLVKLLAFSNEYFTRDISNILGKKLNNVKCLSN